ncbi:MAG: hypothetical protein IT159_02685 [Bryobacterales bacterium]|nr:hypothetical protein [Bryobacterales bacterium]
MPARGESIVLLALFVAPVVWGQVLPPEVSVARHAGGNGYDVSVTNLANSPITALFMQGAGTLPGGRQRWILVEKDYAFLPDEQPIKAGEKRVLRAAESPELKVALFSDGTAAGDPEWIAAVRKRRELALEALNQVIRLVDQVRAHPQDQRDAVQRLKALEAAMLTRAQAQPPGQQGPALQGLDSFQARIIYGGVARELEREGDPGKTTVALEDRLLAVRRTYLGLQQRVTGMAPELSSAAQPPAR